MVELRIEVKNAFGLIDNGDSRFIPGFGRFSSLLDRLQAYNIRLCHNGKKVNAKASMAVCSLGIHDGEEIWFEIEGANEEEAAKVVFQVCHACEVIPTYKMKKANYSYEVEGVYYFLDDETYEDICIKPEETNYFPKHLQEMSDVVLAELNGEVKYVFVG